jgi:hypothetical protein
MSYEHGWAAIHLDMPPRVPRTEYSVDIYHFDLIKAVTGIDVSEDSDSDLKARASSEFAKAWNYDIIWSTLIYNEAFGDMCTRMGHAEYASKGSDFDNKLNCPFTSPEQVLAFDPWQAYRAIDKAQTVKRFEDHYKANCLKNPDAVNMTGIYITCISGLIEIFGWDMMLMALGVDPVKFGILTNRYAEWVYQYFEALAMSDVPVVMVHDDIVWTSGPFAKPDWYRSYVFPNYKRLLEPLIQAGKRIIFTSDGDYTCFIDDIAQTGVNGFVMEPVTDMAYVAEKYGKTHVFIGNADTRILLDGSRNQIRAEVERCMSIGKNCPGYFMCVGNHIPANTPVQNALYYNQVYEEISIR